MQIKVRELTKVYDSQRGLAPTSFDVSQGESVAIVGHNGAGKSTLLKMLAGWIIPNSGDAIIEGFSIKNRLALTRIIGFVAETPNLFDLFTVEYNLKFFARLFGLTQVRVDQIMQDFELLRFRNKSVQSLSKGLKQRVSFGRSMLPNPSVLLLDEPTSGLDYEMTKDIYRSLKKIHADGSTVIFTSHRPEEVKILATRIIALDHGKVVFDGEVDRYFQSQAHEKLYFL